MPATNETIPEKARFDVYAMMVILTCMFTAGASWMLYDDLTRNWGYGQETKPEKAEHITRINPEDDKYHDVVSLTKEDLEDYAKAQKALGKDVELLKGYEWPANYDPLQYQVRPNLSLKEEGGKFVVVYNDPALSPDQNAAKQAEYVKQIDALMAGYKGPAGAAAPKEAPKDGAAPAGEAPKEGAAPTEAPKN
jgi:hypothetical protein